MTKFRDILTWVVGILFIVVIFGMGYHVYLSQAATTLDMTKRILELAEKLDKNGFMAAEILKTNHELLARIDEGLVNHTLELSTHRAYTLESHTKLHDELAKILATQKDETVEEIAKYLQQSREMYLSEFEFLRKDFAVNRELHKQTQRFLKVPQEVK